MSPQPRLSAADMLTLQSQAHAASKSKRSNTGRSQKASSRSPNNPNKYQKNKAMSYQPLSQRPHQGGRDGQNRDLNMADNFQQPIDRERSQTYLAPIEEHAVEEHVHNYGNQLDDSDSQNSPSLLGGYEQNQRQEEVDGKHASLAGYGTLGGEGAAVMSFMAGGQNASALAHGGVDPKGTRHFINIMDASQIDKRHKIATDDGDISVEDQSLADQIMKFS